MDDKNGELPADIAGDQIQRPSLTRLDQADAAARSRKQRVHHPWRTVVLLSPSSSLPFFSLLWRPRPVPVRGRAGKAGGGSFRPLGWRSSTREPARASSSSAARGGNGLSVRHKSRRDMPPLISIKRFSAEGSVLTLLRKHISLVNG